MSRHVVAAVSALSVLLGSGAASQLRYLCHMSGEVLKDCCCSGGHGEPELTASTLKRDDRCCDPFLGDADHPRATLGGDARRVLPTPLVAILPVAPAVASAEHAVQPRRPIARGPPPRGDAPFFVLHCRYLI